MPGEGIASFHGALPFAISRSGGAKVVSGRYGLSAEAKELLWQAGRQASTCAGFMQSWALEAPMGMCDALASNPQQFFQREERTERLVPNASFEGIHGRYERFQQRGAHMLPPEPKPPAGMPIPIAGIIGKPPPRLRGAGGEKETGWGARVTIPPQARVAGRGGFMAVELGVWARRTGVV